MYENVKIDVFFAVDVSKCENSRLLQYASLLHEPYVHVEHTSFEVVPLELLANQGVKSEKNQFIHFLYWRTKRLLYW